MRYFLAACLLLLSACLVTNKDEALGGKWFIRWEHSSIPEAGGVHPFPHRKRWYGSMHVEENTWRYRYLGDDCVIYVAGNSDRGQLYAACGELTPVVIAPEMENFMTGGLGDEGLRGDPIVVNKQPMSIQEIKLMAHRSAGRD